MTEKLSQKNINLIFAVTEGVVNLYQVTTLSGLSELGVHAGPVMSGPPSGTGNDHGSQPGKALLQPVLRS